MTATAPAMRNPYRHYGQPRPGIVIAPRPRYMDSPSGPQRGRPPLHVTIVADNPETLGALETYLRHAGLTTIGTKDLEKACEITPPSSSVVVIFPDEFRAESVLSALAKLRAERPRTLPVLVTKEPKRFESFLSGESDIAPLVVPKPVWGWTILDAIRARLDVEHSQRETPP